MKFSGVVRFLKEFVDAKEKPHVAPSLFDAVLLHESWHVISCVFISVPQLPSEHELQLHAGPVRPPRGRFWKQFFISNGSGGGGGGHTMGTLCQICWGCTAVGKGVALILARMLTGVCHVWKLICSLTLSSQNHRRIYIFSLGKKIW